MPEPATPEVRADIQKLLGMQDGAVFVRGFDRPNLTFRVEKVQLAEKANELGSKNPGGFFFAADVKQALADWKK